MRQNKLHVSLYGKPVGKLELNDIGKMSFTYHDNVKTPLSLSLPIKDKAFGHKQCLAYFGGLVPQGEPILKSLGKLLDINPNNSFEILQKIGFDCPGAVSFYDIEERIETTEISTLKGNILSDKELEERINLLVPEPFFLGIKDLRVTLPGHDIKAAVCVIEDKIAIPVKNSYTTHILKPVMHKNKENIYLEYGCLLLASKMQLNVPSFELKNVGRHIYLLIARYDRELLPGNKIRHYHQEDFCQALGVVPYKQWQIEGGPNLKESFSLLDKTIVPAIDRNKFMKALIFNYLIGNDQAHSKNLSLLYKSAHSYQLAPFHDLMSSLPSASMIKMAMSVGGIYDTLSIGKPQWRTLCHEVGYSYPALKELLHEQIELLIEVAKDASRVLKESGIEHQIITTLLKAIPKHCQKIQKIME